MANIVLIHGAYQGGWIWQRVVSRLATAGHKVFAPSLDGCAERRHALRPGISTETHGAEIAELLFFEDLRDVVLVGTSSGGMVVCKAAELARERVGRLVFADALALFDGECIPDIVNRPTAVTTDLTTGPSPEDAASRMFASLDDAAALAARADVVVSTIPADAGAGVGASVTTASGTLLDVIYAPLVTPLGRAWEAAGGTRVGGERMLLHQAAEQVRLMTGRNAPIRDMDAALRAVLNC